MAAKTVCDARVTPQALRKYCRGMSFAEMGKLFLNLRELLFDRHARDAAKANRELDDFDRRNPHENLRLKLR